MCIRDRHHAGIRIEFTDGEGNFRGGPGAVEQVNVTAQVLSLIHISVPMKIFHGRKAFRFLRKLLHSIQAATAPNSRGRTRYSCIRSLSLIHIFHDAHIHWRFPGDALAGTNP